MAKQGGVGFIGLGTMGAPMALNLIKAGTDLIVWNRTRERCFALEQAGATVALTADELFTRCETIILMLENDGATDAVLARRQPQFTSRVSGKTIISMSTLSADYAQSLSEDIRAAGGRYVEAPVSGSRKPAEAGQLVGMLAGEEVDLKKVRALLAPICKELFDCGAVPGALQMKFAVNSFLITMVTGLAEAWNFALQHHLDMRRFAEILNAGPMASGVSRTKVAKLLAEDFSRQAGIADVFKNSCLVVGAARSVGIPSPLMDRCLELYRETASMDLEEDDMVSVIRAIERYDLP
ncbi:NAD(P)-dependent oxidoreductase [uncultured Cohaesibacter sp.]|uniref:NAD(P)-dependent oxidoreductase n=1 Tax=uncultured Cohaesibacter sp. TaxID=1002546 RepID=UPI002AA80CC0|nr:NAD(P)-dependent oxidoreductase [uncultured Cohaesibacter sp.]